MGKVRQELWPWGQQPQGIVEPNRKLLGEDALVWTAPQFDRLGGAFNAFGTDSGGSPVARKLGFARLWARDAGAGVNFGAMNPLPSAGATVLIVAAPTSDGNRKVAFSQRTSGSNAAQWYCGFNTDGGLGATAGSLLLAGRNTSAVPVSVAAGSQFDGLPHCWVLGNDATSGYIYKDGVAQALTANVRTSGTISVPGQIVRIGNLGDYAADGTFVCDDAIYLVIVWPRLLETLFSQRLCLETAHNLGLIHEPQRIEIPGPTTGSIALVVADSTHAHSAEGVTLSVGLSLSVADSTHAHSADAVVLVTQSFLSVADALHVHGAEDVTLSVGLVLAVADSAHAHSADAVVLTTQSLLNVADTLHAHAAESVTLTIGQALAVADALHAHTASNVALNFGTVTLVVADSTHSHTADNIRLGNKPTTIEEIIPYILNSLFNGRVWEAATPDDLPRHATTKAFLPFIVWTLHGGQDAEYVEQTPAPSHSHARVQLHVVSPSAIELAALTKAARDALLASDYTVGVYGSPVGTYDAARKLRGRRQQFSVWFQQ